MNANTRDKLIELLKWLECVEDKHDMTKILLLQLVEALESDETIL